jgi:hypothetical protein
MCGQGGTRQIQSVKTRKCLCQKGQDIGTKVIYAYGELSQGQEVMKYRAQSLDLAVTKREVLFYREGNQRRGKSLNILDKFWPEDHFWRIYAQIPNVREIDITPVLTKKG